MKYFYLIIVLLSIGCISDDHFGLSSNKQIKEFTIPNQSGTTSIDNENHTIQIPVSLDFDQSSVTPSQIIISNMAAISPSEDDTVDFSSGDVVYTVTAEDASTQEWIVKLKLQQANVQLPNSDYNLWYDAGGYQEPGESKSTAIWGTANKALSLVGGFNTEPISDGSSGYYAKMTTIAAPALVRIAAATLFTGSFTDDFPSVSDPRSNIDFGTPFTSKPSAFKVKYKYQPGDSYEDGNGNPLPGTDEADIYVLLEQWTDQDGTTIKKRVGTAWYRSSTVIANWTDLNMTITYGELPSSDPDFMKPADGYAQDGSNPTHITVVYSSSALGDFFTGAIGSVLEVDDFELIY